MMRGLGYQAHHFAPGTSGATLNFNFLNDGLDPRITFTRASTATYFNSAGVLTTAAIDAPRLDYNPATLAARGLLIEEQRTNSIRNNTMQGAVAGTPGTLPTNWSVSGTGTLTREIVGTGTVNGVDYIDIRFSGTTSSTSISVRLDTSTGIAATNGQTWATSLWFAVVGGSLANIVGRGVNANLFDSGGVNLSSPAFSGISLSVDSTFLRTQGALTISAVNTAYIQPQVFLTFSSGVAIDITLRIGLPQLEQGAFATSVILTTNAAPLGVTRSEDRASVNTLSPWFNAAEGTLFAEVGIVQAPVSGLTQMQTSLNDGGLNNRITLSFGSTLVASMLRNTSGAGLISTATANSATVGSVTKLAVAFSTGASLCLNGGTVATNASYAAPTVTQLQLGAQLAASYANGYLRRITYYPRRLSNAELQALTV